MKIEKTTMEFLAKLVKNNNRPWFQKNRAPYETARDNILEVTRFLIGEIAKFDSSIMGVEEKDCLFRIFRDARFSKDKSPYKTNFGAFIKSGGRGTAGAGYYFHVEPGGSMTAGGIYMPPAPELLAIRRAIAKRPVDFEKIILDKKFTRRFGGLSDERLKTAPKGFPKDHPAIEHLKWKHYIVFRSYADRDVVSPRYLDRCLEDFVVMAPFNEYLNRVIGR
jgi:uncharacterized protein (TIGR02453 family)